MSEARETIMTAFVQSLWDVQWEDAGPALVTRNLRKATDVKRLPAIFLLAFTDDVIEYPKRGKSQTQSMVRDWEVGVVFFLAAPSEEDAPTLLEQYSDLVRLKMQEAAAGLRIQALESRADVVLFPEFGNSTIGQALWYRIIYVETLQS